MSNAPLSPLSKLRRILTVRRLRRLQFLAVFSVAATSVGILGAQFASGLQGYVLGLTVGVALMQWGERFILAPQIAEDVRKTLDKGLGAHDPGRS